MAGYSGTPLIKKLGFKPGKTVVVKHAPAHYRELLGPLPTGLVIRHRLSHPVAVVHIFATSHSRLVHDLAEARSSMTSNGMIWVSWPKKASKVPTDVTEDVIRDRALQDVLVDVKVCAVDDVWSGLKLMIRKEHRK